MEKKDYLKVGDKVMWRGGFGSDPAKEATIESIEICARGSKYGTPAKKVLWKTVRGEGNRHVVVTLTNGHWCKGHQLSKMELVESK